VISWPEEAFASIGTQADQSVGGLHVAFRLLAATGARRGGICGLRWSSVDLDRRVLWIRQSVERLRTGELSRFARTLMFFGSVVRSPVSSHMST